MLETLGLSATEGDVYHAAVRRGETTLTQLADRLDLPVAEIDRAVTALAATGLVRRERDRVVALRPELAIDGILAEREARLQRARVMARSLAQEFRAEQPPLQNVDVVQIVDGAEAIIARHQELELSAREELCTFERPPYLTRAADTNQAELTQLARGVHVRGVVASAALEVPGRLESLRREAAAGEQVRVLPDLPLKMVISDGQAALVPLTMTTKKVDYALLIGPCALLDALVGLFEALWARAVPLQAALAGGETPVEPLVDRDLLALLAAGVSDSVVARQLGVSERTLRRRIGVLLDHLGARTRFQAGLQARDRGLL